MVKLVDGGEFSVSKRTISATRLSGDQDSLVMAAPADQGEFLVMQTVDGYFIRFAVSEIPEKKKTAVGVRGIRLQKKDEVDQIWMFEEGTEMKVMSGEKEVSLHRLKTAKRDGIGTRPR